MADNAAIHISDASLLGSKYLDTFRAIKSFRGLRQGGMATGLKIDIGAARIAMNLLPAENIPGHLAGLEGYIRTVGCASKGKLLYTLSRLQHVQCVLGCVIKPGFDARDKTTRFLHLRQRRRLRRRGAGGPAARRLTPALDFS
jgi:hypothetical protein